MTFEEAVEAALLEKLEYEKEDRPIYVAVTRESCRWWYLDLKEPIRWSNGMAPMAVGPGSVDLSKLFRDVRPEDLRATDWQVYRYDWTDF